MDKHTNEGTSCPNCEEKLTEVCEELQDWFRKEVKPKHQDAHISWGFRDEASQDLAVKEGKSNLEWPQSNHNHMDSKAEPCSLAIDLFCLNADGQATWQYKFMRAIADEATASKSPIKWGGTFKTLADYDHFELDKTLLK